MYVTNKVVSFQYLHWVVLFIINFPYVSYVLYIFSLISSSMAKVNMVKS